MSKAGWKYIGRAISAAYTIGVDQNCGRIFLERDGFVLFEMSDRESVALAKKVLAANETGAEHG